MSRSAYDQWASIYDAVYSYVRDDIPFYVKEALDSGGDVLELGCGTGRVTIPIAQAGINIVGLDFSEAMLDIARSKAEGLPGNSGELSLQLGDMRDFDLGRQFSLIIIPFRGFLSLLSVEDEISTLREIRRHLLPDGRLVGREYIARNPRRADRRPGSFKVNINTGKWADFACDAKGGDVVSLAAYLSGAGQAEAARALADMLGLRHD